MKKRKKYNKFARYIISLVLSFSGILGLMNYSNEYDIFNSVIVAYAGFISLYLISENKQVKK